MFRIMHPYFHLWKHFLLPLLPVPPDVLLLSCGFSFSADLNFSFRILYPGCYYSVLQELQRGLNAPFTLRQIDGAEFEQRLNAVWQRDSSELAS